MAKTLSLLTAAALVAASALPAHAWDPLKRQHVGDPSDCERPGILSSITSRFAHQVRHVPHLPQVSIEGFHRIHQHRYVGAGVRNATDISRRYCMATAAMSDGSHRSVWYMIEYGMGFAGAFGDGVQFCVAGFDRWKVYDAWCRVVR
ncbi:MAG: hypothetical protein KDJ73_08645 [Notoacmeibacter sp.]|nr:hypothetical protein [Notoacmeibacter sp.]MCC0033095.1 hypothetical protein [Brucellaceae bacterium]